MTHPHVLFLQGLPSPFFTRLAQRLAQSGWRATGINLCVGDQWFWKGPSAVNYRGRLRDWPTFIGDFYDREGVTDIVLLGEQRSYHQLAISAAQLRNIRVTVTDFGYLRPDWMAFERDGMGGDSRFPKLPDDINALADMAPPPDLSLRYTDSFWTMAVGDMAYHFGNFFLFFLFPFYRRPYKRDHPLLHYIAIGKRLLWAKRRHRDATNRTKALFRNRARYFLFPLQLENDFQIVAYSSFSCMEEAIVQVVQSFALHAEPDVRLWVKVHPLDPGLKNWKKRILQHADKYGIAHRIDYFDGGNLDDMISGSNGVVTINSTVGIRALQLNCPVMALGQAIYQVPGLTCQGELDRYWTSAQRPDPALVARFIAAICNTIQIRGVFYSEPGLSAAVDEAANRLLTGTVGCSATLQGYDHERSESKT